MIASLAIAALGLAAANDRSGPPIEEKFHALFGSGRIRSALELLRAQGSIDEISRITKAVGQWTQKAKDLDDLAARVRVFEDLRTLAMLRILALQKLAAAGDSSETSVEERFRLLYGLGDKEGAYVLLFYAMKPKDLVAYLNAIVQWVVDSRNLDELGERYVEHLLIDAVATDILLQDETNDWMNGVFLLRMAGDPIHVPEVQERRPEVTVPVFAPMTKDHRDGVRSRVIGTIDRASIIERALAGTDVVELVTSWDATRILSLQVDPVSQTWVARFRPLTAHRFYGSPPVRTPIVREPL